MKNETSTAEAVAGVPASTKQSERAAYLLDLLKRRGIWAIILVSVIGLSIMEPLFINPRNLINILLQASIYGVMAIGMTFLMINGYFDLSVGTVMGLCAALAVGLQSINLFVAVAVSLLVGLTFGMINGFLVTRAGINAFIVTLASMFGARGLVFIYTKEQAIVGSVREFGQFGASRIGFMPTLALVFIVLLVIAELFLRFSVHGRNTYAIGGNYEAASNAGINVKRTIFINFALTGLAAALGGIMLAARMNAATPALGWPDTNLMIIAAVVLGGTKLTGGYGSMINTLGGVLAIQIFQNGMNLLNVQSYYNTLFMGIILILVVFADSRFSPTKK